MYDAIVVGARCAGSPLLLARKGYKVLLTDRSTFPSDLPWACCHSPKLRPTSFAAVHCYGDDFGEGQAIGAVELQSVNSGFCAVTQKSRVRPDYFMLQF
jgi:hypothetical protein